MLASRSPGNGTRPARSSAPFSEALSTPAHHATTARDDAHSEMPCDVLEDEMRVLVAPHPGDIRGINERWWLDGP